MTSTTLPAPSHARFGAYLRSLSPLWRREWIQHRFAWALLALIPLGLAALTAAVGEVDFGEDEKPTAQQLSLLLALIPVAGGTVLMLVIALVTAVVQMAGLARRDHGDRSVEYWLSLPVPHAAAMGVPMAVHLLLIPAAAMATGWLGGHLVSLLLVGRLLGAEALAQVPWGETLTATLTLLARLVAGLPLAVLWALPIVLLLMVLNAVFKRWGFVVLIVGLGLLSLFEQIAVGQRWLLSTLAELLRRAGQSLVGAGGPTAVIEKGVEGTEALQRLPAVAAADFAAAVAALASPLFAGALLFSAACFALLLRWRARGAARAD